MTLLSDSFRTRIERFLAETGMGATEFGRQSVGDPSFVGGLRRGRSPTLATADRVLAWMAAVEAGIRGRGGKGNIS